MAASWLCNRLLKMWPRQHHRAEQHDEHCVALLADALDALTRHAHTHHSLAQTMGRAPPAG
jgi:hypothetical protein